MFYFLKLLRDELLDHWNRLETNSHPYYRVKAFIVRDGYAKWRADELAKVSSLIRRFWHKELPPISGMGISFLDAHEEYKVLHTKLFR